MSSSEDLKIKQALVKSPLNLIPLCSLYGTGRVFQYGAFVKYAPGNWHLANMEDGAGARYAGAALRHLEEMQSPNGLFTPESLASLDSETQLPHIDHLITTLLILRSVLIKNEVLAKDPGPPTGIEW